MGLFSKLFGKKKEEVREPQRHFLEDNVKERKVTKSEPKNAAETKVASSPTAEKNAVKAPVHTVKPIEASKAESKPAPKPAPKTEAKSAVKNEPKQTSKPEVKKPAPTKEATKPIQKIEAKPAIKSEPKPAIKSEAKAAPKAVVKNTKANDTKPKERVVPAPVDDEKAADKIAEDKASKSVKVQGFGGAFDIKKSKDGRYVFNLYAANRVIVATSQIYSSSQSAVTGIKSVIANAERANIEDQTLKQFTPQPAPKWEIYIDRGGQFRWRLIATNGSCILHSQGYTQKSACKKGMDSVIRTAKSAQIDKSYLEKE